MLLLLLLIIPIVGVFIISTTMSYDVSPLNDRRIKVTGLATSLVNLVVSLIIFIAFDFSVNQSFLIKQKYL